MRRSSLRILHIEDDGGDRDLFERAIRRTAPAAEIQTAFDGEEALQLLITGAQSDRIVLPDVILLDLNLPKKDGRQLLVDLKQDERLRLIPVVILTTSNAMTDIENCYRHGVACYLVKPIDYNELVDLARKFIEFWRSVELVQKKFVPPPA